MKKLNRKIVVGSFLAACMLMIVPSVSALQFKTIVDANKSQLPDKIQSGDLKGLTDGIKILTLVKLLIKLLLLAWRLGTALGNPFGAPPYPFTQ
jgi:hypothetical protein